MIKKLRYKMDFFSSIRKQHFFEFQIFTHDQLMLYIIIHIFETLIKVTKREPIVYKFSTGTYPENPKILINV